MIGIIIQARMGSSRLPGKVLKKFGTKSLLEIIIDRLTALNSSYNAKIIIATTNRNEDDLIEQFCISKGVIVYRGDELNVLKRYYDCATAFNLEHIVRMTADNPFPDVYELNRLIDFHISNGLDYSECHTVLPIGVGMEIFSYKALKESMEKSTLPKHFEHVDEYILDNLSLFKTGTLTVDETKKKTDVRLTVDTEDDYYKACYIINNANTNPVTTLEAIQLSEVYEKMGDAE